MQFLNTILVFASLVASATTASADAATPIEARQAASPCYSLQSLLKWNTGEYGSGGGWGCVTNNNGGCTSYYWTTELPYYVCT